MSARPVIVPPGRGHRVSNAGFDRRIGLED
jgi:oxalate decarboxylase/phosphoglucose isomerase-like protein (cupin superfamily)